MEKVRTTDAQKLERLSPKTFQSLKENLKRKYSKKYDRKTDGWNGTANPPTWPQNGPENQLTSSFGHKCPGAFRHPPIHKSFHGRSISSKNTSKVYDSTEYIQVGEAIQK